VGTRFARLRRDERGQALVELALALPLLLFVVFCIIDFGLAVNTQNSATNIANITARAAAVTGSNQLVCGTTTETSLINYVNCQTQATAPTLGNACSVTPTDTNGGSYTSGDSVKITVVYPFSWLGVISGGVNSTLRLPGLVTRITQSATMRMEQASSSTILGTSGTAQSTSPTPAGC
jgi:Flp pilus assembly protein TadG